MVDGIVFRIDQLPDGHHGVALPDHVLQHRRQGLRRVEGGVVEQHDGPGAQLIADPFADGPGVIVLPVQTVPIGKDLKSLRRKGLRVWG